MAFVVGSSLLLVEMSLVFHFGCIRTRGEQYVEYEDQLVDHRDVVTPKFSAGSAFTMAMSDLVTVVSRSSWPEKNLNAYSPMILLGRNQGTIGLKLCLALANDRDCGA